MDIFLIILASLCLIVGLTGSVLPVLPGPPVSWLALLFIHFSSYANYSFTFLAVSALIMVAITLLDFYIPIWGTKKLGGTKAGVWGCTIGLLVGIFLFPPIGIIIGPFVGAFIGELIANQEDTKKAFKSALGSFAGFLLGTGLKLIYGGFVAYYFIKALF